MALVNLFAYFPRTEKPLFFTVDIDPAQMMSDLVEIVRGKLTDRHVDISLEDIFIYKACFSLFPESW